MVRCFMTGVELTLESALVLNRREARDLLVKLQDRVASLRRLIEQFSPLDEEPPFPSIGPAPSARSARKRHRLVCKAVESALAPAFPEVRLFVAWPEYQARVQALRGDAKPTPAGDER